VMGVLIKAVKYKGFEPTERNDHAVQR
jgi:hypothetical protein